jgi:hypothetical protein
MPSQSSLDFLERQKVFLHPSGKGAFATNSLHSHKRPLKPIPELLEPDTPLRRIVTQKTEDRKAWQDPFMGPIALEELRD